MTTQIVGRDAWAGFDHTQGPMICLTKTGARYELAELQLGRALQDGDQDDIVMVEWGATRHARARVEVFRSHGLSKPLDGAGFPALVVSSPDDSEREKHTISLHMIGTIRPYHGDEWRQS